MRNGVQVAWFVIIFRYFGKLTRRTWQAGVVFYRKSPAYRASVDMEDLRILELFSGIGGMHLALKRSGIRGEIIAAIDINTLANYVYQHNFPDTKLYPKNILSLSEDFVDKLDVNAILMSPPCQPFTRLGNRKDTEDNRNSALQRITDILPRLHKINYVLLENVFGFESSEARNNLINAIDKLYDWREFDLTPRDFHVPNSRRRYYLMAVRKPAQLPKWLAPYSRSSELRTLVSKDVSPQILTVGEILEFGDDYELYDAFLLSDKELRRVLLMDIVTKQSMSSCCFTKSYGRYAEGTGSVYSPLTDIEMKDVLSKVDEFDNDSLLSRVRPLRLRVFTPKEIQRLMSFPESFNFPNDLTKRQLYGLLGNSINVKVVSYLIELFSFCEQEER